MKKRIQKIFFVLSIAVILSMGVGASVLQGYDLNEIININNGIDGIRSQNLNSNVQANIEKDDLNNLELHFLDVGQGDSTLIILPNGKTALIDAGTRNYGTTIVNYIKDLEVSKIDYLIMTHPDADHIGGMAEIIDNFDIGNIYMTDRTSTTKTFEDLLLKMDSKDLNFTVPKTNDIISEFDDLKIILLSPIKEYDDNNEMSLVIQITYGNNAFILMGDAGIKVEEDILNSNENINADLIKVGHHGSSSSSSAKFIEKLSPQFAIISCGENNQYGHPNSKVLEILNNNGVEVYRTDELGHIIAISDGNTISITNKH